MPKEVKNLVLKWLIGRDLQAFFQLFKSDHQADQDNRRLDFWMRYLDLIEDAYFALGEEAYLSQKDDYVQLRRSNPDRILRLENGGSPKNNAFIMKIGQIAIVEFGDKGKCLFSVLIGTIVLFR